MRLELDTLNEFGSRDTPETHFSNGLCRDNALPVVFLFMIFHFCLTATLPAAWNSKDFKRVGIRNVFNSSTQFVFKNKHIVHRRNPYSVLYRTFVSLSVLRVHIYIFCK